MSRHDHDHLHDQRTDADRQTDAERGDDTGLSTDVAVSRQHRYGRNTLVAPHRNVVVELLSHFWGPIAWMIEAALVLTAITGRWADFWIILALLVLNGGIGFWEEHQAASAIAALKRRLATQARVRRDGAWAAVPAAQIVPGDLVKVGRGEIVPADAVLVGGGGDADESMLTGESLPAAKQAGDPAYSGSAVARGELVARVLAIGEGTQFGRTAQLAGRQAPPSHFQRAVVNIGKYLIIIAVILVAVIVAVSLARGTDLADTLEFALVVTIASIPVALPAVLSVTMAVGARYLARHQAVVSRLPAIEEMAGVDVLCADKTGTVTRNELAVADVTVVDPGSDRDEVLRDAALTAEESQRDPIDVAILAAAGRHEGERWQRLEFVPFDSARKYATARVRTDTGATISVAKGATQAVLSLTGTGGRTAKDREGADAVAEATRRFAERGYRALAVARRDAHGWRVTGVIGLQDPPRNDSRQTLVEAARLGVDIKMVTGDRVEIAREIARTVGIGDQVLGATELARLDDTRLPATVARVDGFAQVVPEDKYRIVAALQADGHIVGMTGDGVNDAPALRRADAGIAVSGATEAARAAADIVLLAPGLSAIVAAVHRAREVFARMKNYAIYRITETIRVVVFITVTIVAFGYFPVTPTQVVLLAILNDAAILSIAYDRVLPAPRPQRWNLIDVVTIALVLGLFGTVSTVALVWISHAPLAIPVDQVRTLIYLKLSVSGHFTVFLARTRGPFWSHRPAWVLLFAVIGTQVLATALALTGLFMTPIGVDLVALAWGWAAGEFLLLDPLKLGAYRVLGRRRDAGRV